MGDQQQIQSEQSAEASALEGTLSAPQSKLLQTARQQYATAAKQLSMRQPQLTAKSSLAVIASTDQLLQQSIDSDSIIKIRLLRAGAFELLAKVTPATTKIDALLAQGAGVDRALLKAEILKVENGIAQNYKKEREEIVQARLVAPTKEQQAALERLEDRVAKADVLTRQGYYSFLIDGQVKLAEAGEKKTNLAAKTIAADKTKLEAEQNNRAWYTASYEYLSGAGAKREQDINNQQAKLQTLNVSKEALSPALKQLKNVQANGRILARSGRVDESLALLKGATFKTIDTDLKQHGATIIKVAEIVRPVATDASAGFATSVTTTAVASTGYGLPVALPAGVGAGTTTGVVSGALFDVLLAEGKILLGQETREEAYNKFKANFPGQSISDAKSGAITSVGTLTGIKAGQSASTVINAGTKSGRVIVGAAGGAASGATSEILNVSNALASATIEFVRDPKLNVQDSKQRLENYKAFLKARDVPYDDLARKVLTATLTGGAGGAIGAKADDAREGAQSASRRAVVSGAEALASVGVDATTNIATNGVLTSDDAYRSVTGAIVGRAVGRRHERRDTQLQSRRSIPHDVSTPITEGADSARFAKANEPRKQKNPLIRVEDEMVTLTAEDLKKADTYTRKKLQEHGIPLVEVKDITRYQRERELARLDRTKEFSGKLYELTEFSFDNVKTKYTDPLAPALLHQDMPALVAEARKRGYTVLVDSSITQSSSIGIQDPMSGSKPTLYLRVDAPFGPAAHEFNHALFHLGVAERFGGHIEVTGNEREHIPGHDGFKKIEHLARRSTNQHMAILDAREPLLANAIRYKRMSLDEIGVDESLAVDRELAHLKAANYSTESFGWIAAENYKLMHQLDSYDRLAKKALLSPEQRAIKEDIELKLNESYRVLDYCRDKYGLDQNDFILELPPAKLEERLALAKKPIRKEALGLLEVDPYAGLNSEQIKVERAVRELFPNGWEKSSLPTTPEAIPPLKNGHIRLLYKINQGDAQQALDNGLGPYDLVRRMNPDVTDPLRSTDSAKTTLESIRKAKKSDDVVLVLDMPETLFRDFTSASSKYDDIDRRFIVGAVR